MQFSDRFSQSQGIFTPDAVRLIAVPAVPCGTVGTARGAARQRIWCEWTFIVTAATFTQTSTKPKSVLFRTLEVKTKNVKKRDLINENKNVRRPQDRYTDKKG